MQRKVEHLAPRNQYRELKSIALEEHVELRLAHCVSRDSLDIRLFRRRKTGSRWRPQPAGFGIPSAVLPELLAALREAATIKGTVAP